MFEAQTILHSGTETSLYSPWFDRQASSARFTLEIIAKQGTGNFKVEVATTKRDVGGDGTVVSGSITSTTVTSTPESAEWMTNLEDMVRYVFTLSGSSGDWVLFRMLPPVWFDALVP